MRMHLRPTVLTVCCAYFTEWRLVIRLISINKLRIIIHHSRNVVTKSKHSPNWHGARDAVFLELSRNLLDDDSVLNYQLWLPTVVVHCYSRYRPILQPTRNMDPFELSLCTICTNLAGHKTRPIVHSLFILCYILLRCTLCEINFEYVCNYVQCISFKCF